MLLLNANPFYSQPMNFSNMGSFNFGNNGYKPFNPGFSSGAASAVGGGGTKPGGFNFGDVAGGILGSAGSQLLSGLIGTPSSTTKQDSSTKATWNQGLAQQQYDWMQPDISNLMAAAGRGMQDMGQAKSLLMSGMGPTDISELKSTYNKLRGQDLYKSYDEGLGTLKDYRNQLSTGTTSADVQAGRQMKEAQRGMALQPGMTAAQRGATTANMQGQAADSAYGQRLSEYGGATSALAQGQMGRSALESQNIQAAGQLAAQMSGFRAGDLNRYIAGSQMLSQMAMQNPELAAIYAVMGLKQGIMGQTMGQDQKSTTKQSGSGLLGKIF